jgi:antitoxin PrlF
MATRITVSGRITLPREVREALRLSPGDAVQFTVSPRGEVVLSKKPTSLAGRRTRAIHPRVAAQTRRRAAELVALLRGLD